MLNENPILLTDSYKASHYNQYPPDTQGLFFYIEARKGGLYPDTLFFGLQIFLKEYMTRRITEENIEEARKFFEAHGEPFNEEGWRYILEEYNGHFPVTIKAVPEGSLVPESNVLVTVECEDPNCFWAASYLETALLRSIWYPCTVATNSYNCKKVIKEYLDLTSDKPKEGLPIKLHDFGARGVSSHESACIGGAAHLVNFVGSDTIEGILTANKYYNCDMAGFSIPACYDEKTEILTTKGFKLFKDLNSDDKVAQYVDKEKTSEKYTDKSKIPLIQHEIDKGKIEFVIPEKIHSDNYNGKMIRFYSIGKLAKVDLVVTPNHRMIRRSIATGEIEIFDAETVQFSNRNHWIQAGEIANSGGCLPTLDRLKIAFQADGSYPSRKDEYDGSISGCKPIRFGLKEIRKIERLEQILKDLNYEYNKSIIESGEKKDYNLFWIKVPIEVSFSKTFEWINLETVSIEWCKEFIEEVAEWDGKRPNESSVYYSTTVKDNAEIVQCIGILAGYRTTVSTYNDKRGNRKLLYEVISTKSKNSREGKGIQKEYIDYNGNIYCVTVPSGMIVVRRNGIVSISGNSEHSTITSWGKDREVDAYRNMLSQYAKPGRILACVSDSYDIYRVCEEFWGGELKQMIIDSGATLVVRPDSGDPQWTVLHVIETLGKKFGYTLNNKGFKILNYVRVIQGDGININTIKDILSRLYINGWSSDNINFGMGAALLQHLNRDTLRFAMKCSSVNINGEWKDVFKSPIGDPSKVSKSGRISLYLKDQPHGKPQYVTMRIDEFEAMNPGMRVFYKEALRSVYSNGILVNKMTFDEVRDGTISNF